MEAGGIIVSVGEMVDVVVVTYRSSETLRRCIAPLVGEEGIRVTVVDNASGDDGPLIARAFDAQTIELPTNLGFAVGCNVGWRAGQARTVLFLNPDATIDGEGVRKLAAVLDDPSVGAVGPRIVDDDGGIEFSQRRYPRLLTTFARALYLHRVFPDAPWADEMVRDADAYESSRSAEWLSGACLMLRRETLDELEGFDEGFFMYSEDVDLCRRTRDLGLDVRFVSEVTAAHRGGASAPRPSLYGVLAASRLRYARKHERRLVVLGVRLGLALEAGLRLVVSGQGRAGRRGHAQALRVALTRAATQP